MINSKTALLIIILSFLFPVFANNVADEVEKLINETDPNINIGFGIRNLDKILLFMRKMLIVILLLPAV